MKHEKYENEHVDQNSKVIVGVSVDNRSDIHQSNVHLIASILNLTRVQLHAIYQKLKFQPDRKLLNSFVKIYIADNFDVLFDYSACICPHAKNRISESVVRLTGIQIKRISLYTCITNIHCAVFSRVI